MELRQLRYFVTVAEELHFGHAAAREHIVQSALSQQMQRLERELGVRLLDRSTHHVKTTAAGDAFLREVRAILAHVDRAVIYARRAAGSAVALRVSVLDASYDSMPRILRDIHDKYPALEIHQIETGVPQQFKMLVDGRLDVGLGRAALAPPEVAAELVRLDPVGVLVRQDHPLAARSAVPTAELMAEPLLLADDARAPEYNLLIVELCRSVGFAPTVYRGTVDSIRAATALVGQGRCVLCAPASCVSAVPELVWRPLIEPSSHYPWSVLWRADDRSEHVLAILNSARRLSHQLGWLEGDRDCRLGAPMRGYLPQ